MCSPIKIRQSSKNEKLMREFIEFCRAHPELRFWQALRAWAGVGFILVSDENPGVIGGVKDTFYWEDKNE